MAMQQQHPYFGMPEPVHPHEVDEERRRLYKMNTTYPKGTKEPDSSLQRQMLPPIEHLQGPLSFPGPSHVMPHSLDNNSPSEVSNDRLF